MSWIFVPPPPPTHPVVTKDDIDKLKLDMYYVTRDLFDLSKKVEELINREKRTKAT